MNKILGTRQEQDETVFIVEDPEACPSCGKKGKAKDRKGWLGTPYECEPCEEFWEVVD